MSVLIHFYFHNSSRNSIRLTTERFFSFKPVFFCAEPPHLFFLYSALLCRSSSGRHSVFLSSVSFDRDDCGTGIWRSEVLTLCYLKVTNSVCRKPWNNTVRITWLSIYIFITFSYPFEIIHVYCINIWVRRWRFSLLYRESFCIIFFSSTKDFVFIYFLLFLKNKKKTDRIDVCCIGLTRSNFSFMYYIITQLDEIDIWYLTHRTFVVCK